MVRCNADHISGSRTSHNRQLQTTQNSEREIQLQLAVVVVVLTLS